MTIQLSQVYKNNMYKDDMYVTISNDAEIESLLYLKFYNNINNITVELMQTATKQVIRKILLMEHIDKVIYRNQEGDKEEINSSRRLIVKINEEQTDLISDDAIIKFQQILDITNNFAVVQQMSVLNDEILDILQKNETEYIRIMDYGENKYTIQQIRAVKEKATEIISSVSKTNETEKFIELYTVLSSKIAIDNLGTSYGNVFDLIYEKTTMSGYAEILTYILDEMQIKNKIISGKLSTGEFHYWNQVNLDCIWYNVDLALDAACKKMEYCLKCDEEFYEDHITLSQNIEICNYNSNYFVVEEVEKKSSFLSKLFAKLGKLFSRNRVKKLNPGEIEI